MKTMTFVVALALLASAAAAQPAHDLFDAQNAARQHQRDLEPALIQAKASVEALTMMNAVERALSAPPAFTAIGSAYQLMDDFNNGISHRGVAVPRDVQQLLRRGQKVLDDARLVTPTDFDHWRDDFHHKIAHPLTLMVVTQTQQLISLQSSYDALQAQLRNLTQQSMNAVHGAASDPMFRQ